MITSGIDESQVNHYEQRFLITRGTDTMVDSAQVLAEQLLSADATAEDQQKTIVLLGVMVPYQFKECDGLFNLGCAVSAVQNG